MSNITRFQIKKLHGYKNFDLKIENNIIILVGENGSGKTTVLRLLFNFLSGQWVALLKFRFDELVITIDGKLHTLPYGLLEKSITPRIPDDPRILRKLSPPVRRDLSDLLEQNQGRPNLFELESFCDQFDVPLEYIIRGITEEPRTSEGEELNRILTDLTNSFDATLLYLPTYRRIEQELKFIFKGFDDDEIRRRHMYMRSRKKENAHIELIEFGMKDVEMEINKILEQLKEFQRVNLNELTLGYLGEIVEKKYLEVDVSKIQSASSDIISNVLERIQKDILSPESKQHLSETIQKVKQGETPDEHAKVICHYFIKLLNFQHYLQQKETQITSFCEVCNQYMVDKNFFYDSVNFKFLINTECQDEKYQKVELHHLSSGEKQIVSLFSQLYLSDNTKYFVLIDEPELSLSVPWQRKFLMDIKNGNFCSGLIAVTHSPFIYDNELEKYAHGLGEFLL